MLFDRVKELSEQRGESLKTVAQKLGFSENAFYKWKKQSPKSEALQKVADYFNVSTDYLLGRTDVKTLPDDDIETLAAHHEGEDWTEEELEEIERFKEFVRMKRKDHPKKGE
ncbi:helix-turn-helix transcriptional regulator [Halalkalibacterium halodurans]|uniref:helix-turn-helix domain-containing protein n=1 Tax=Halalkalibacterium halodurans TaxID=86665 RepID=UPI002E1C7457|nr:helix-turn-helix transcriptional regulator [Halalkalibacterium halodurans]MED4086606.1 helix-turn-helix transcriptional regulator [Halalkalibacterium halodurans]MED4104532.1 helix-turn-helix transcriptional regulator [Halalkalibacterium halodurans]MED4110108.1 helix-turn-helix transcriptional regulator [Halalkalibacterium halodurans]MED4149752.1 helix-turn-helix transcriptional regulator [Halalkalibacterium halodurans]